MLESSKYNVIWKSISEPNIITHSDSEYASFLKNLERTCNKSGCLDSKFYTQQFKSKSSGNKEICPNVKINAHSYDVSKFRDKFNDEYEKRMKKISQALLEEKRKERILKREEGDIIKKEYVLNRSLYEFDSDISLKKFNQDLELNKTEDNLGKIHKKYYYDKSKNVRERMKESVISQIDKMGKSRQSTLNVSKLLRQFNAKKNELDTNAKEIEKLMKEFEKQLERKENKQRKLQNEAEIYSQALKREKLKFQVQQEQIAKEELKQLKRKDYEDKQVENLLLLNLTQSDDGIKASISERKSLDIQLNLKNNDHKVKSCEYHGSLNSIRRKLRQSEDTQSQLIKNGNYLNLVLKNTELNSKLETANCRKLDLIKSGQHAMINTRTETEGKYQELSKNRQISLHLENESENIGHLKDVVRRDKENERKHYKNMSDTIKEIKQITISINQISKQLHDTKALNSSRINEEKRLSDKHERLLEDELNRQQTKLLELQSKRNNYSTQLIECRKYLKDDEYHLMKSDHNKMRMSHIKEKTDQNQSFLPIVI